MAGRRCASLALLAFSPLSKGRLRALLLSSKLRPAFREDAFLCSRPGAFRTKPETRELNALVVTPEMRPEPLHQRCNAEGLQIIVEVFPVRHKQPGRDALRDRPARERKPCVKARAVVIAGDVKTLEACLADAARQGARRTTPQHSEGVEERSATPAWSRCLRPRRERRSGCRSGPRGHAIRQALFLAPANPPCRFRLREARCDGRR